MNLIKIGLPATLKRTKLKLLKQVHLPSNGKATYRFHRALLACDTTASYITLIGSKMSINSCNSAFENRSAKSIRSFSIRWQMNLLKQF